MVGKSSHKYYIESEKRIKKPEIWKFIKNLNIFGSKTKKFINFRKISTSQTLSKNFFSVVGIAAHWNQNKNQKTTAILYLLRTKKNFLFQKFKNIATFFWKFLKYVKFFLKFRK